MSFVAEEKDSRNAASEETISDKDILEALVEDDGNNPFLLRLAAIALEQVPGRYKEVDKFYKEHEDECREVLKTSSRYMTHYLFVGRGIEQVLRLRRTFAALCLSSPESVQAIFEQDFHRIAQVLKKKKKITDAYRDLNIPIVPWEIGVGKISIAIFLACQYQRKDFLTLELLHPYLSSIMVHCCYPKDGFAASYQAKKIAKQFAKGFKNVANFPELERFMVFIEMVLQDAGVGMQSTKKNINEKHFAKVIDAAHAFFVDDDMEKFADEMEAGNNLIDTKENVCQHIKEDAENQKLGRFDQTDALGLPCGYQEAMGKLAGEADKHFDKWYRIVFFGLELYELGRAYRKSLEDGIELFERRPSKEDSKIPEDEYRRVVLEKDNAVKLAEKKQNVLNKQSLVIDKLKQQLRELKGENSELKAEAKEFENIVSSGMLDSVETVDEEEAAKVFPSNTVLFGGHPNWQNKFSVAHPEVRVIEPDCLNFSIDILRNANLVLLNVDYMSHKTYFRIMPTIRRKKIPLKYIH